ncbi:centromere-associated protein E isoform X2 [Paralichthys olivaceus]|uniref:centromere-associated protein E isoform X2 n=1 Tax=Paralichthys olivaceus TaxID=8255 RepID=UPI003751795A
MTEESAVKVCVRVRPLIAREESAASENAESVQLFWKTDKKSIHQIDDGNSTKTFSFDRVFTAEETTNQLYQDIAKPLVVSTVEGYNGTIFAYGQTSSGKTFTMMGSDHIPGVIPLAVEDVFQTIKNCPKKEFLLRVSYMEIYNETVTDLLVDSWKRKPLEVRETINKNIYVADLTEELVISPAQALAWIRKGEKNRHYGKTKMNQRSSRSHTIFRMILESRERSDVASGENADGAIIVSHLNLVDLAGSERASQTGAEGTRFKEGCNINRSLFTLGQVIKKVTEESQKGFTNYRDSKLTRILQNSLGGNAKTVIICTITPVTLDETLSTLQFASTAKKMKNDPHVTEVSDDGALLKRYRNEIVDLKRRLHEVSSVTQTTVTEKEVLSQLLQEKDSLQREQEDRIKNLTKLLVTSTNQVPVKKMPKRRVTWGGKMLRLATSSACGDSSNLSFAESFTRKRKADRSCLMELTEDDEEFEANWEIPDEPSDDMEISQSSVTVRSFGDSPKDYTSPDWMRDFSGKEEAMTKVESLEGRVAELELQLQTEAQQKQEALEKVDTSEKRAAEMEQQQQSEAQQKLEAKEKVLMLELRVADLERQLEEQRHGLTENEQIRREFADTIQLCETLASEKDMVVAERDYLKQELGMFIEQTERLEKEKAALSQELEEKRETDEFKSLEEEFKKEQELEVQNEISSYKKVIESTEVKCQELQNKVDTLSEEILKKTKSAEQLQRMSGEELVQEVAKLRRSLDDAEGVSRDTKKEWAVLRSQNITLEEIKVTLTSNLEKMEAEVNSLCSQLEIEKSRYRKMESDLQKELTVTFDENTKLTNLLDGKVPKNLIDCVEFERTVATLSEELTASREAEGALRVQLEELASSQTPHKVDNLMKQVCELSEELSAVQSQRESLLSAQAQYQEEAQQLQGLLQISHDERVKIQADLSAAALREQELILHCTDVSQQLNSLHSDRERSDPEIQFEEICLKLEESDQQRALLVEKVNEMQQLIKHLEKKLADSEVSRTSQEEISKELQEQLKQQTQVLQCVQADKEALLSEQKAETPNSAEEMDQLLSTLTSVTAERDQLKMDLQENVEMMIENQEELRTALEKNREQKELLSHLETLQKSEVDGALTEKSAQLEARQKQLEESDQQRALLVEKVNEMQQLIKHLEKKLVDSEVSRTAQEEISKELQEQLKQQIQVLQCVQAEKEALLSERKAETPNSAEEMDQLLSTLTSVTAERDQLKMDLQENVEMMIENEEELRTALEKNREQKELLSHLETLQKSEVDGALTEKSAQLEARQKQLEESDQQRALLVEKVNEMQQLIKHLEKKLADSEVSRTSQEEISKELQEQLKQQTQVLQCVQAEKEALLSEQKAETPNSAEEMDQLLSTLTSVTAERDQLKTDLQENVEMMIENQEELRTALEKNREQKELLSHLETLQKSEVDGALIEMSAQLEAQQKQIKSLTEQVENSETSFPSSSEENAKLLCRVTSLCEERDQLQETLQELRQENQQLRAELEDRMETLQCEVKTLTEKLESTETERDSQLCYKEASFQSSSEEKEKLLCRVTSLSEERDQLQETLQELRQENQQLKAELEDRMENLQCEVKTLTEKLESTETERDSLLCDKEASFQSSSEEKEKLLCRVTSLSEERDQLQETLQELRQENQQLRAELEDRMKNLQCEVKTLTENLESTETERDSLLCYKEASFQSSSEEKEKLLCRVTSLSEERDQLQETLQELRQENQQLKAELEDRMENLQCEVKTLTEKLESTETERDSLLCDKEASYQSSSEEKEKLLCRVTSLCEEKDKLQETLQELRQENQQLKAELEDRMENLQCEVNTLTEKLESTETERDSLLCYKEASFQSSSEEKEKLLCRVTSLCEERDQLQETLQELRQENQQLKAELEDRMENLQCEVNTLTEKLESTETERDTLLCYKEASFQSSSEEKEKLLCRVTSLSEERDQLQETLQELRQENQQLKAELEDRMENLQCEVKTLTEKLESTETERDSLLSHKEASFQSSSEEKEKLLCRVMSLCEERDQLQETLQELRKENQQLRAELEDRMENLQCELLRADRGSTGVEVTVSSRLNDSTRQLQETFRGFEHFIDKCSKYISIPMDKVLRVQSGLNHGYLTSLPKSTMSAYTAICQLGLDTVQTLGNIVVCLQVKAQDFRNRFEELVKKDLSVFEERRLQDVLLCRVQAPSFSVKDEDFHTVWEHRLTELLDKRELYQQKMSIILEKFLDNVASHPNELSAEITLRERFKEQLQGTISTQPISFGELDSILSCELDRRAALAHSKKMILQDITAEQSVLSEELKLLEAQACFQLREEKSKSSTLLQAIEGAPLKTELSLLKDNQNLLIQLKHTEEKVKALHVQNEQLEEAQIQAKDMLSSHKQATQLLQTELQDSRAQHDEKEMTIKTLRGKLQECEKRASPSAVELENLQTKLFKMEVELSSASDKHQQEIQKMSTVLAVKEESLRNLKETLRRLQQQGEESFLQGEDLHTKLTNTRGLVIKSSILLDKAKLEEEVKQLYLKITELECLVSTQQTEISKWKSRAISLKVKSKVEVDKPSSPCTTAKRGPQETADSSFLSSPKKFVVTSRKILDSPRKVMDFPKVYQLHSPKSRLFDVGGSSDLLSRTYPKQFFDNSSLGTIPDAAAGVDAARKDEWWPQSPKQEDMCKTQ